MFHGSMVKEKMLAARNKQNQLLIDNNIKSALEITKNEEEIVQENSLLKIVFKSSSTMPVTPSDSDCLLH